MSASIHSPHSRRGDVVAPVRYGIKDDVLRGFGQAPADEQPVRFQDLRGNPEQPRLFREGFELFQHRSAVTDFENPEVIAGTYLPEIRDFMRTVTGTPDVFMQTNWVIRAENKPVHEATGTRDGRHMRHNMKTGGFLHLDYDPPGAELWAARAFADAGVPTRPRGRLLVLTAWRAISPPPQDKPLALLDRRLVSPDDLIHQRIALPHVTWHGYQVRRNPAHRFSWWSNMTRDEVILFTQHEDGIEPISAAPHTAFHDPTCPPDTPTRHSIEVRGYCFLKD